METLWIIHYSNLLCFLSLYHTNLNQFIILLSGVTHHEQKKLYISFIARHSWTSQLSTYLCSLFFLIVLLYFKQYQVIVVVLYVFKLLLSKRLFCIRSLRCKSNCNFLKYSSFANRFICSSPQYFCSLKHTINSLIIFCVHTMPKCPYTMTSVKPHQKSTYANISMAVYHMCFKKSEEKNCWK